ncbi:glycine betaine ABC transporter substrate-binding protein [Clostridium weizhouense]|uniref:Glycine betaine ABC transporter substrate-binding protein n=1 Tax=Clostridium weizhouense TaxID=2859781 RepID=A0ABS7AL41_9CLOT|nr:glycine betaine ABC transporter substrate-binding protein [Clostridium weizhouense]MBW6409279.1 glycine betaine ABC transporter substrate-binding protein [Clostridium weizhouense]
MNKSLKKIMSLAFVGILAVGMLGGCGKNSTQKTENSKGKVTLGYVNWADGIAMTNLAKAVLEDKMGYEVEMKQGEAGMVYTSVSTGDMDAFLDSWLPLAHKDYMDKYGENIEKIGTNFEGAKIGLVVPSYMDINSIEDLNKIKDQLEGKIIGIDPGAGIMKATDKAIQEYGLDLDLVEGSGVTMTAMLKKALDKKEPIVVTGWEPHWKFARWDLKFLDDPKKVYGENQDIYTIARKGFSKDMPEVSQFLNNFKMDSKQLGSLMGDIQDNSDKDPLEVAKNWMKNNEDLVNSWIPKE